MEEVYRKQLSNFESFDLPNQVYKLKKVLCGLKQAPRAWYDRLRNFLLMTLEWKKLIILFLLRLKIMTCL